MKNSLIVVFCVVTGVAAVLEIMLEMRADKTRARLDEMRKEELRLAWAIAKSQNDWLGESNRFLRILQSAYVDSSLPEANMINRIIKQSENWEAESGAYIDSVTKNLQK